MSILDDAIFSSRDVDERIYELTSEFTDATGNDPEPHMGIDDWEVGLSGEDAEELYLLMELYDDLECVPDWTHGETIIREDAFTDYCREVVIDCGYISSDFPDWIAIDWDATADAMRADYVESEVGGHIYLAR